jgi:hypothetical protein
VEKKKAKTTARRFPSDSNLTAEDHARIARAFKHTLGEIRRLYKSPASLYQRQSRNLKKRLKELGRKASSFIEPS